MDVTAVMDSINKKSTNSSVKRSRSTTVLNNRSKTKRTTSVSNKINVREYFTHERPFVDVKIQFNQEMIWCDKALLAAASPVLCEELLKMNSKDNILVLNDVQFNEFLLLLEFIYPIFNPEINLQTISCLIKLSHRFQFTVLKHACRFYIMKYLNTIQHVSRKCHDSEVEEEEEQDYSVSNNNHDNTSANENYKQHDLIKFHDGICIDAYDIVSNLCQWLKIYFYEEDMILLQSIITILQQISVNNLHRVLNSIDINDEIKAYIYKERAQYLEEIQQIKHIA